MSPEDVFNASKIIKDLNEVQKKASSLCEKLKKEKRLSSILKSDIARIDELDEMNETVKAGIRGQSTVYRYGQDGSGSLNKAL